MTTRLNRQNPMTGEVRRPTLPIQQQSEGLFLGWGPKF